MRLYFSAITLSTVGDGDPTPSTAAGKLFTVFYVSAGVGIIVAFAKAVARASVVQRDESRTPLKGLFRTSEPVKDDLSNREE